MREAVLARLDGAAGRAADADGGVHRGDRPVTRTPTKGQAARESFEDRDRPARRRRGAGLRAAGAGRPPRGRRPRPRHARLGAGRGGGGLPRPPLARQQRPLRAGRPRRQRRARRAAPAVRRHVRHPRPGPLVRRRRAVRGDPGRTPVRPGRRRGGRQRRRGRDAHGRGGPRGRHPRAAVAADDRLRAPEPDAVRGPGRRPDHRPRAAGGAAPDARRPRRRDGAGARDPVRRPRRLPRGQDGEPVHDFSGVDRVYDTLLELGLRPVVELSYMPHDLAADPRRRCSPTTGSSPRRGTGTGGPTSSPR